MIIYYGFLIFIFVPVLPSAYSEILFWLTSIVSVFSEAVFSLHINHSYKVKFINMSLIEEKLVLLSDFDLDYILAWGRGSYVLF